MTEPTITDLTASATTTVNATPDEIFAFLRNPENHATISGDGSVQKNNTGPAELSLGDKFGMSMKMGLPYRISSKVVEYEENDDGSRKIAWCHMGKHRWRWEISPTEGGSIVTETFDMEPSFLKPALRMGGYPKNHGPNVAKSVDNLAAHFA